MEQRSCRQFLSTTTAGAVTAFPDNMNVSFEFADGRVLIYEDSFGIRFEGRDDYQQRRGTRDANERVSRTVWPPKECLTQSVPERI